MPIFKLYFPIIQKLGVGPWAIHIPFVTGYHGTTMSVKIHQSMRDGDKNLINCFLWHPVITESGSEPWNRSLRDVFGKSVVPSVAGYEHLVLILGTSVLWILQTSL